MIKSNKRNRSGITLLFVISMIVLFLLMGASFVVMSTQFRRSSVERARIQTRRDDARTLVNRAFYDLFRGPTLDNRFSPLRGHSILGDQYGYGARAQVSNATFLSVTNGQLFVVELGTEFENIHDGLREPFSDQEGVYDGLIVTFVDGPIAGVSTRVVNYEVVLDNATGVVQNRRFYLMPQWIDQDQVFNAALMPRLVDSNVVVNGRPFAGTGAGVFDPSAALNTAALGANANVPNRVGEPLAQLFQNYLASDDGTGPVANPAATNESWDAVDAQNMFLAAVGDLDGSGTMQVIPSFHHNGPTNGSFLAIPGGGVDVDNDLDGLNDGIWMDTGMPLQTDLKGRVYKPLVSYLVIDMDGKPNVNAAGNLTHVDGKFITAFPDFLGGVNGSADIAFGGQGYGPPEINLAWIFDPQDYTYLLKGDPLGTLFGTPVTGRYGSDGFPGTGAFDAVLNAKMPNYPLATFAGNGLVGGLYGSPMDIHGRFSYAYGDYSETLSVDPYDDGALTTASVPLGMPIANVAGSSLTNERVNNPYEMSFAQSTFAPSGGSVDTPFSAREMERVLRLYDSDAVMLPPRLRAMTDLTLSANPESRLDFTTDSQELPVIPTDLVNRLREALILGAGLDGDGDGAIDATTSNIFLKFQVNSLISPEVKRGMRLNVNRLLGNGLDENGNNVIDDPAEMTGAQLVPTVSLGTSQTGIDELSHQQFARHLYILTLLVTEQGLADFNNYDYNMDGVSGAFGSVAYTADIREYRKDIAQWAINVANFRDPDSIMQPFEVDLEPWDGWHVNGIIGMAGDELVPAGWPDGDYHAYNRPVGTAIVEDPATKRVLWGVERPELLMTESAAFHDRRTEDLTTDASGDDVAGGDDDLDNLLVPKSSVFFELYNPWAHSTTGSINGNNQIKPAEFYGTESGVVLQKTSLDGTSPVWRILVTNRAGHNQDPDGGELDPANNLDVNSNVIRRVYFAEPDLTIVNDEPNTDKVYYSDIGLVNGGVINPGQHAVIGSAGVGTEGTNVDMHHTYLGRTITANWADTRRISIDPVSQEVELRYYDSSGAGSWETILRRNVVTLPINTQAGGAFRSLGITDPVQGYQSLLVAQGLDWQEVADGYQVIDATLAPAPQDEPLDRRFNPSEWAVDGVPGLKDDGLHRISNLTPTDVVGRVAHLQRLANPLEPFDVELNPYLTVDSLGVPVNVFNGVANEEEVDATTDYPAMQTAARDALHFKSYERGETDADSLRTRWLWKAPQHGHLSPTATAPSPGDQSFVSFNLENSLGELDQAYRDVAFNQAFPWLTWNNRPYSSHLELTNVPYTSSYRLLSYFDTQEAGRNNYNPPDPGMAVNATNADIPNIAGDYGHLLSFHAHSDDSPRLQTVLDYLEVPSRFFGTETFLNELQFQNGAAAASLGFTAPFHSISNYRYPGKVNINTVFNSRTWNSVMGPYATEVTYGELNASVRGGAGVPVEFDAPFRFTESVNHLPTGSAVPQTSDAGLFRRINTMALSGVAAEDGLFDRNTPAFAPRVDPTRSAYFRNDMRQRMGNLVTNRSSVFSIWITIGFFEVDENLVIGQEVGSDTGEVQRYRGFYMVDRSIPVAFEPGFNHNVDQAILTSSITERAITRD
jgi:hypothetical protein